MQCKAELRCPCPNGDGGACGSIAFCLRNQGHSGQHSYDSYHECWHFEHGDTWHKIVTPKARRP